MGVKKFNARQSYMLGVIQGRLISESENLFDEQEREVYHRVIGVVGRMADFELYESPAPSINVEEDPAQDGEQIH